MNRHKETFLAIEQLGSNFPPYLPTYNIEGEFINEQHDIFSICPVDGVKIIYKEISGSLRRADALKLYEMAYFAKGDIYELGCFQGLSTCIMAQAIQDSSHERKIFTVDINSSNITTTTENLKRNKLMSHVETICDDALIATDKMISENHKFDFVFIDHSHADKDVFNVCQQLDKIIMDGGFCFFHDYNDRRNKDSNYPNYGVYQGVEKGLNKLKFEFYGIYGCAALYRFNA